MLPYRFVLIALALTGWHQAHAELTTPAEPANAPAADAPRYLRGTDKVTAPPVTTTNFSGPPITFKFESAPVLEVVQVVLGDILKVDYVLHQPIAGSVTLATRAEVSPDQAAFLLESALLANGLVMARDARGTYHVGRPDVVRNIVPSVRQVGSSPLPPGYGAIVVPLQYIGATEMATILRPMLPADALVRVDTVRNLIILAGTRSQAEGWMDMVATFDVNLLKGMSVGVFPLKHATVREVETALRLMAGGPATPTTPTPGTTTPARPAGAATPAATAAQQQSAADSNPFFGSIRVMPIERINSILVVSPRAAYLDEARVWIERLDRPSDNSTEPQLFVYPVQNGSARHLADVLNGVFGGGQSGGSTTGGTGVAPGLTSGAGSTSAFGMQQGGTGYSGSSGGSGLLGGGTALGSRQGTSTNANQAQGGISSNTLLNGVRIVADQINNAILVYGPRSEYNKIEASMRRLDAPPTQVLIEASIVEVTLSDGLEYGLQWYFNDKQRNGLTGTGVLSTVDGGALGGAVAGFSYTLRNSVGDVRAVLNALADKSLIKVISSPSLMVLDNYTAGILVGTQQPIKSGETITTGGNVSTNIQYKDTGVSLQVTPSVNAGNIVTMDISQAVTDVGAVDQPTGQRSFLQRQIASKVAVRSGEALVLGGLIRDNTTTSKSGVPLLQDIPLVGALFGTNNKSNARTELLVVITPKVVRSDFDIREVSGELRERMKGFSAVSPTSKPLRAPTPDRSDQPEASPLPIR
jgi:general secretion pathway protein D